MIYPYPDKQYYISTDSSKISWSGILVQYAEQAVDDGTKIKIPHPITFQNGNLHGSQKNWGTLTKEAYAIYMSFCNMVFYLKEAHEMVKNDDEPLRMCVLSNKESNKVNNWSHEMHAITLHSVFELIKGKENVVMDSLSRLMCLGLHGYNEPEEAVQEYGKSIFDTDENTKNSLDSDQNSNDIFEIDERQ